LGPEGGAAGGELLAQGTPEEVAEIDASHTGRFLKKILNRPQEEISLAVKQSA
jgi:excinuclease ABC subunit A